MSKTKRLNNVGFADSDRNLVDLAQTHGTPLYVYDLRRLRARAAELRSALSGAGVRLFFATMANDREPVLRLLADVGVGACVNSIPHLDLAVASGFIPEQIQFTSTGVTTEDMRTLQRRGIRLNVDSLTQLKTWFELGALEAGIRVNAASLKRGVRDDRIGIEASEVHSAVTSAAELNGKISGLHIYVGTNFQHHEEMLPTLEVFFDFAASIRGLSYVNIGGGIGIDYQHHGPGFDIGAFGDAVSEYTRRLRARLEQHVEVIIEPGRGLTRGRDRRRAAAPRPRRGARDLRRERAHAARGDSDPPVHDPRVLAPLDRSGRDPRHRRAPSGEAHALRQRRNPGFLS